MSPNLALAFLPSPRAPSSPAAHASSLSESIEVCSAATLEKF